MLRRPRPKYGWIYPGDAYVQVGVVPGDSILVLPSCGQAIVLAWDDPLVVNAAWDDGPGPFFNDGYVYAQIQPGGHIDGFPPTIIRKVRL